MIEGIHYVILDLDSRFKNQNIQLSLPFAMGRYKEKLVFAPQKKLLTRTQPRCHPDLRILACRSMRNKVLLFMGQKRTTKYQTKHLQKAFWRLFRKIEYGLDSRYYGVTADFLGMNIHMLCKRIHSKADTLIFSSEIFYLDLTSKQFSLNKIDPSLNCTEVHVVFLFKLLKKFFYRFDYFVIKRHQA